MSTKKREFVSSVTGSKLENVISGQIAQCIKQFEGRVIKITIERYTRRKTSPQDRYRWGVLYKHYLDAMLDCGDDTAVDFARQNRFTKVIDGLHEMLLRWIAGKEQLNKDTGEIMYLPCRTSQMNTIESNLYDQLVRELCFENYGYKIPLPDSGYNINEYEKN